jgi:hypothetical protein
MRTVTITLPDALVAEIEMTKIRGRACGLEFSVTEVCKAALADAIPRAREEFLQRSDIMGHSQRYRENHADD